MPTKPKSISQRVCLSKTYTFSEKTYTYTGKMYLYDIQFTSLFKANCKTNFEKIYK